MLESKQEKKREKKKETKKITTEKNEKEVVYFWKEKAIEKKNLYLLLHIFMMQINTWKVRRTYVIPTSLKSNLRIVFNCFSTELSF